MHWACTNKRVNTCQLLCAFDGVDENAINKQGKTALDVAVYYSIVDCVRALLELNVDASKAVVEANTIVEIVQLLDEHRKRSVKLIIIFKRRKFVSFCV